MRTPQRKFTLAVDEETFSMAQCLKNEYGVNLSELFRHSVEFELNRCRSRQENCVKSIIAKMQTVLSQEKNK